MINDDSWMRSAASRARECTRPEDVFFGHLPQRETPQSTMCLIYINDIHVMYSRVTYLINELPFPYTISRPTFSAKLSTDMSEILGAIAESLL